MRLRGCEVFGLAVVFIFALGWIDLDRRMTNPETVFQSPVDSWDDCPWIGSRHATHVQRNQWLLFRQRPGMYMVHLRDGRQCCRQVSAQGT